MKNIQRWLRRILMIRRKLKTLRQVRESFKLYDLSKTEFKQWLLCNRKFFHKGWYWRDAKG